MTAKTIALFGIDSMTKSRLNIRSLPNDYTLINLDDISSIHSAQYDLLIIDYNWVVLSIDSDTIKQISTSYLIYGITRPLQKGHEKELLSNCVGIISTYASTEELCMQIELGLNLQSERKLNRQRLYKLDLKFENYQHTGIAIGLLMNCSSSTISDAFKHLKSCSRNKQRCLTDISEEIIRLFDSSLSSPPSIPKNGIAEWLDNNISLRNNKKK